MAVSSEDKKIAVFIHVARVAITSSRAPRDHSDSVGILLGGRASVGATELESSLGSSSHGLVVGVEALVSVLDEEGLLHGNARGRRQAVLLFFSFDLGFLLVQLLLLGRASVLHLHERSTQFQSGGASVGAGRLSRGTGHLGRTDHSLPSLKGGALLFSLGKRSGFHLLHTLLLLLFSKGIFDSLNPFFCCKIEDREVVELFGEFEDTTEHEHLRACYDSSVATSRYGAHLSFLRLDFLAFFACGIPAPEIAKLVVIIVSSSENVELVLPVDSSVPSTRGDLVVFRNGVSGKSGSFS